MIKFRLLQLDIGSVIWRFYLMMAGTILLGLFVNIYVAAIWGGLIAISAILGVRMTWSTKKVRKVVPKVAFSQKAEDLRVA